MKFFSQLQCPRPTISTFERLPVRLLHVRDFSLKVLGREVGIQRFAYLCGFRKIWKRLQQSHQHPVTVYRRVPVVATIERGMQNFRTRDLARVVDNVLGLIRKLAAHTLQRERCKVRSLFLCKGLAGTHLGTTDDWEQQYG